MRKGYRRRHVNHSIDQLGEFQFRRLLPALQKLLELHPIAGRKEERHVRRWDHADSLLYYLDASRVAVGRHFTGTNLCTLSPANTSPVSTTPFESTAITWRAEKLASVFAHGSHLAPP